MDKNAILILGDSTSMSIGMDNNTYPFILANNRIWPKDMLLLNCSLPGFTSADAAFFFNIHYQNVRKNVKAVIIYLGNCDAASSEVRKGRFTLVKRIKMLLSFDKYFIPKKTKLKNRLLHYEWNNQYKQFLEKSESPEDFEFNLANIIRSCSNFSIPVLLVKPKANLLFPPGLGKGNFIFYNYLDYPDKISDKIKILDKRFIDAARSQEAGNYQKVLDIYLDILLFPPSAEMSQEYAQVILNNYAVTKAELGDYDEAIYLLNLLLKEKFCRAEIVYFNLAQINKRLGKDSQASEFLLRSYELDESLYRIREPYKRVLNSLAAKFKNVEIIDMSDIPDQLFLDHCHLLPEGQNLIAKKIQKSLQKYLPNENSTLVICNNLYNPELGIGNTTKFHEYFNTYASYSVSQISAEVDDLRKQIDDIKGNQKQVLGNIRCSNELKNAIEYCLKHPCFPRIQDILNAPPIYPSDIGRFPEYFVLRFLMPYVKFYESNLTLMPKFDAELNLIHSSESILSILPERVIPHLKSVEPNIHKHKEGYVKLVLDKVVDQLDSHLKKRNQIFERIKSTIFWYVRESLRFGSHSRISMLYDRLALEYIAEGLLFASILNYSNGYNFRTQIELLISYVERATKIHESFCQRFSFEVKDRNQLIADYDESLSKLHEELANFRMQP